MKTPDELRAEEQKSRFDLVAEVEARVEDALSEIPSSAGGEFRLAEFKAWTPEWIEIAKRHLLKNGWDSEFFTKTEGSYSMTAKEEHEWTEQWVKITPASPVTRSAAGF